MLLQKVHMVVEVERKEAVEVVVEAKYQIRTKIWTSTSRKVRISFNIKCDLYQMSN